MSDGWTCRADTEWSVAECRGQGTWGVKFEPRLLQLMSLSCLCLGGLQN